MADFNTYIKLHRSIVESAVFSDAEVLRLWIYLLCKASVDDRQIIFDGKVINMKKGQLITGRKKIAEHLNTTESKAYRSLKLLQKLGCIDIDVNNRFSLVTIVNWGKFQGTPSKSEQQNNSTMTAQQQQTDSGTTAEQQHNNTNNNVKECINNDNNIIGEKQKRKRFLPPTVEEVKAYCLERKNNVNAEKFIDYYTSNGWQVGKNKMKDWKAAVRTWEKNNYSEKNNNNENAKKSRYDYEALSKKAFSNISKVDVVH